MISNYEDFNPINEDWRDDLVSNTSKFSSNILDDFDITNAFAGMANDGFVITSKLDVGYVENDKVYSVSRKADFLKNKCFAIYNIKLLKNLKHSKTIADFRRLNSLIETYLDKYELCCRRLNFQDDVKIIRNEPDISSNQLRFDISISVGDTLPKNFVEIGANARSAMRLGRNGLNKVLGQLNNNRMFNVVSSNDTEIVVNIDDQYKHLDVKGILSRITRDMNSNIQQNGDEYKIVFE